MAPPMLFSFKKIFQARELLTTANQLQGIPRFLKQRLADSSHPRSAKDSFPFARSTAFTPEWPIGGLKHVPDEVRVTWLCCTLVCVFVFLYVVYMICQKVSFGGETYVQETSNMFWMMFAWKVWVVCRWFLVLSACTLILLGFFSGSFSGVNSFFSSTEKPLQRRHQKPKKHRKIHKKQVIRTFLGGSQIRNT